MDALTHAVEAYIGINGSRYTDEWAEYSVSLIFENLESVYRDGAGIEGRAKMALAAFYAGLAVTRTNVGYVHAIAHSIGGLYGVAHGLANSVILPHVLEFFKKEAEEKLAALALVGGIGESGDSNEVLSRKFIKRVKEMNSNMNIPTHIMEIKENDVDLIVKSALSEAHPDYPVPKLMNYHDCEENVRKLVSPLQNKELSLP